MLSAASQPKLGEKTVASMTSNKQRERVRSSACMGADYSRSDGDQKTGWIKGSILTAVRATSGATSRNIRDEAGLVTTSINDSGEWAGLLLHGRYVHFQTFVLPHSERQVAKHTSHSRRLLLPTSHLNGCCALQLHFSANLGRRRITITLVSKKFTCDSCFGCAAANLTQKKQ